MLQFPHSIPAQVYAERFQVVETFCQIIKYIPLNPHLNSRVFHQELLKSSLFSAKIEGNKLTFAQVQNSSMKNPRDKRKREIANVHHALQSMLFFDRNISKELWLKIHGIVMKGLSSDAGFFRTETSAIYDGFGNIVYVTPSSEDMKSMFHVLIEHSNTQENLNVREQLLLIAACHYYGEKIHPFVDGNGRTGRVMLHYQLHKTGMFSDAILPIDQFFHANKRQYYDLLEKNTRNIQEFAEFFLKGIEWSLKTYVEDVKNLSSADLEKPPAWSTLLPRRQEIFFIIKDHPYISMDTIARRFPTIPRRTVAYDLQKLLQEHLVIKHGSTRGSVYSVAEHALE